jgi:NAD(P)-dependent dehydrogenase (short-subunit alcohol dehydrogenase family)
MASPLDLFRLDDRVAVVTGGASGVGRGLALGLAAVGARVVIADLPAREGEAASVAALCGGESLPVDVAVPDQARALVAEVGRVDVLVNCAGIIVRTPSLELSEADWDRVLDVNLKGAFFMAQAAAASMVAGGRGGAIVNIASINGLVGAVQRAGYTASKGGLVNLTRTLALEWAEHGVRVNAIAPTYLRTPLTMPLFEDAAFMEYLRDRQPLPRDGTPEDIVGAAIFLCSDASALVTGHTLAVDGGWTAA